MSLWMCATATAPRVRRRKLAEVEVNSTGQLPHLERLDAAHEAVEGEVGLRGALGVREEGEDAQRRLAPPPHQQHPQELPHPPLD